MIAWLRIAIQSAIARKGSIVIMVLSTTISVAILLGVFKIRDDTKTSFSNAISGVDLVLGAKGSPTELILYSVFHIGRATNTISAQLETKVRAMRQVAWMVPIQLGDSYRGYPVVGTSIEFFQHIRAQGQSLRFTQGRALSDPRLFEVVLGSAVAKKTNHRIGEQIAIAHGSGSGPKQDHSNSPFKIIGILEATGTPIDQTILISTNAFDALHDIQDGGLQFAKLNPESQVSAFFIGLKERSSVFSVRRRRELAIFRALGVKPYQLLSLILIEAFLVCLSGIILGWFVLQGLIYSSADYLRKEWGVVSELGLPTPDDLLSLLYLVIIVLLFAGIPAIKAYRMALNDGLNPPS